MLKISDRSTANCLVIEAEGAISGDDYDDFADAFERAAEDYGEMNLVVVLLGSVKYGDWDAFEEDLEFVREGYRSVRRSAFVGDQKLVTMMMKAFSAFTRAEEKFFESGDVDAAIDWACATTT